jgi:hypothetical protein
MAPGLRRSIEIVRRKFPRRNYIFTGSGQRRLREELAGFGPADITAPIGMTRICVQSRSSHVAAGERLPGDLNRPAMVRQAVYIPGLRAFRGTRIKGPSKEIQAVNILAMLDRLQNPLPMGVAPDSALDDECSGALPADDGDRDAPLMLEDCQ